MRRLALVCFLAPLPFLGGCLLAAASATAVVASQEFVDHATVAYMNEDHRIVWDQTKETLTHLSLDPIEVDEAVRAARANIDGANVVVHVEIHDASASKLSIGARKWGFYDSDTANDVLERIKTDLDR